MSGKPGIPEWQRASSSAASTASTASTTSTNDTDSSQKPEEEEVSAQQQPQQPPVEAPTPTEDDVAQPEEEEQQASETGSLLEQAARFLDDPTIHNAPREKKVAFLESKGVSAEDIGRLLGEEEPERRPVEVEDVGDRAWSTTPPKPAQAPEVQVQPREIPPIVTYPEFLASTEKPPPLITTERLATTAYIAGGFMASMYGLSKYIIAPMTHGLAESRRDFASHTNEQLKELNERLRKAVSVDPASKAKPVEDGADHVSEADSDPTELYHRDFGTQTTPNLSRRPSTSSDPHPTVTAQENRLKIIKSHLEELESHGSGQDKLRDRLRTKISDLSTYLTEMDYQNQYYPTLGRYGATFNWTSNSQESKNDQIEVLKGDIRAVKGVFLSARNFPTGGRNATPMPTGRVGS